MKTALFALALLLSGCAASTPATTSTPAPPTTPAAIDQKIATSLADAAAIIQGLEPLVTQFPSLKAPLNQAIGIYTAAKAAAIVYDTAVTSGGNPDATQLQAQVQQVLSAVTGLQSLYGVKP